MEKTKKSEQREPEILTPIKYLKGIGEVRSRWLAKLGVKTVLDLMEFFPRAYIQRAMDTPMSLFQVGQQVAFTAQICWVDKRMTKKNQPQINIGISDGKTAMVCTWFKFYPGLEETLKPGGTAWFNGTVSEYQSMLQLIHPDFEILDEDTELGFWKERPVLPVYPLSGNLTQKVVRNAVLQAFSQYANHIEENLPEDIIEKHHFEPRKSALQMMHFTTNPDKIDAIRRRFVYEEFYYQQLMWARHNRFHTEEVHGITFENKKLLTRRMYDTLPFQLTSAQKRLLKEIFADMTSARQMNRLIQGDVGSGKTIVTLFAMLLAIENGYQAVLMAPTEILAEQHYGNIRNFLGIDENRLDSCLRRNDNVDGALLLRAQKDTAARVLQPQEDTAAGVLQPQEDTAARVLRAQKDTAARVLQPQEDTAAGVLQPQPPSAAGVLQLQKVKVCLLKGGQYKGKKEMKEQIASGEINLIIGTHALLQEDVVFKALGFICVDEQHRFGVEQRAKLAKRNTRPDLLYLSATPIPRSLAMTVYGDLEVSILDELPPNRKPVSTFVRSSGKLDIVYGEIRKELTKGRQVYIVCPLIEESEKLDLLSAETLFKHIHTKVFPEFTSALLHGRMKSADKDAIMHSFKQAEIKILVSTTVIEVGVDVPNATVMLIEHAERFGLAQLHQLRGRVGRGADQAYCFLIEHFPISAIGRERLATMTGTTDGFIIAEKDLELRGPGEFFGTEQSGMPKFRFANLVRDQHVLKLARNDAFDLISDDFAFAKPEHKMVQQNFQQLYAQRETLMLY
jgi:ATP-dependent DNA helicase RecG